jgi:hypothetical protein
LCNLFFRKIKFYPKCVPMCGPCIYLGLASAIRNRNPQPAPPLFGRLRSLHTIIIKRSGWLSSQKSVFLSPVRWGRGGVRNTLLFCLFDIIIIIGKSGCVAVVV